MMSDWETGDEVARAPKGVNGLMLAVMGLASLLIAIIVLAVVRSILFRSAPQIGEIPPHPAIGQTPAAIELEPLAHVDGPVTLQGLSGKVVLINFWATWCGPCWLEAPHVARLGKKYRDRPDFALLTISCGETMPEDVDSLRRQTDQALAKLGLDMPTYVDTEWTTRRAFAEVGGLGGIPSTYLLDGQGTVRGAWEGFSPEVPEQIEQLIRELLQEADGQREAEPSG
jgi:thiol-disulfide isomerase/thioredoxin